MQRPHVLLYCHHWSICCWLWTPTFLQYWFAQDFKLLYCHHWNCHSGNLASPLLSLILNSNLPSIHTLTSFQVEMLPTHMWHFHSSEAHNLQLSCRHIMPSFHAKNTVHQDISQFLISQFPTKNVVSIPLHSITPPSQSSQTLSLISTVV